MKMKSDETEFTIKDNRISTTEDEDKKFVSQAVAFVIGHTRNGFVALCASVATLLKEQARLKIENEALKQQIALLQSKSVSSKSLKKKFISTEKNNLPLKGLDDKDIFHSEISQQFRFRRKKFQKKSYKAIKDCICDSCINGINNQDALSAPLKAGDKVVVSGEICGTVCYIGHVESLSFPEIFVGLHLDEEVGDTNGRDVRKTYFTVPQGYGLFVPLLDVCCIIE